MPQNVLVVDDEKHTREGLAAALELDYEVFMARDADEAFRLMDAQKFDVVLTDLRMAGKNGLAVIDKALAQPNKPVAIMMTAYGNVETAVEAMRRGAYDFLPKPVNLEKLELVIKRGLKARSAETEAGELRVKNEVLKVKLEKAGSSPDIIGHSDSLMRVMEQVEQVAPSKATVMLRGETGTGKELFAKMIHRRSNRAEGPFVPVHCAAIPANLLESELFGHEKGAFTDAREKRIGRFEAAHDGTLFLDEIGEIDASTQVKLLRFLETRTIERLGSHKPVKLDVRLVCATNRDLLKMAREGLFREDLYYRLCVVAIVLPPLRDRRDDIPLLVHHYVRLFSRENEVPEVKIPSPTMKLISGYRWPGNIRELRNFCENIVVMHRGAELAPGDLDARFHTSAKPVVAEPVPMVSSADVRVADRGGEPLSRAENEKRLLTRALTEANGNRTKAAALMGISRRTLHRKLLRWPEIDSVYPDAE